MPSSLSPFLCFELLDECGEMRGDGDREGVVQAALVVGGAAIATRGAALIALRIAQPDRNYLSDYSLLKTVSDETASLPLPHQWRLRTILRTSLFFQTLPKTSSPPPAITGVPPSVA